MARHCVPTSSANRCGSCCAARPMPQRERPGCADRPGAHPVHGVRPETPASTATTTGLILEIAGGVTFALCMIVFFCARSRATGGGRGASGCRQRGLTGSAVGHEHGSAPASVSACGHATATYRLRRSAASATQWLRAWQRVEHGFDAAFGNADQSAASPGRDRLLVVLAARAQRHLPVRRVRHLGRGRLPVDRPPVAAAVVPGRAAAQPAPLCRRCLRGGHAGPPAARVAARPLLAASGASPG